MIEPGKLFQLQGGFRRRKLALCFGALERDIAGIGSDYTSIKSGSSYPYTNMSRSEYTKKLVSIVLEDPKLSVEASKELSSLLKSSPFDERRACNCARNHLLSIIGTFPAEWDLVIAPHAEHPIERPFYPGVFVYAEDIRSPFNLGSIFRTAEAFGVEGIFLSPFCADPSHPRAQRSAMGCTNYLNFQRSSLEDLPKDIPVFALETGGTLIEDFVFPQRGIVIIGSEELGTSPQALERAEYGRVSIPLLGIKASLNVGVAFGVLIQMWTAAISAQSETIF